MNDQPEAAAKAAEAIKRKLAGRVPERDQTWEELFLTHFAPILTTRDEQIAALTDKLATVTAECEKWAERHQQAIDLVSTHAATIEGLRAELGKWKSSSYASDMTVAALRARVAELERERDETLRTCKELEQQRDVAIHFKEEAQSELAKVRREKEEEAESYAAVIRINGSQHETIRDGLYRKLDAFRAEAARIADDYIADSVDTAPLALQEMREAISALATQNPTT